ncbi:MAG: M48 family metallopeptidase [Acidobacteriota bacterium]
MRTTRTALVLLCFALLATPLVAQQPEPAVAKPGVEPLPAPQDLGPVAVPEPSEKAMRYYRTGNAWWVFSTLWAFLIPALFLFTGFSARIRDFAQRIGRKWFFVIAIYVVIFNILNYLINLPMGYFQGFVRQHAYDLSNQTLSKWLGDGAKGLMVALIVSVLFTWVPYLLLEKSPKRWWLFTAMVAVPFMIFANVVGPIWVSPLFNDFGPMQNKQLEGDILALAERAGIEGSRVFEVNKSVDTKAVNAYVAGFMNTKRIVLWDTIIEQFERDELLFVMGHEMGHYALKHVLQLMAIMSVLILVALYVIYRVSDGLLARFGDRFGFHQLSDIASLPLLILLANLIFFILTPVITGISRHNERESDRFGLELLRDNRAAATAFVKLQQKNLGNPRPGMMYKLWRSFHPTLGDRIDFCNSYRPWETGEPLKYEHLVTPPASSGG